MVPETHVFTRQTSDGPAQMTAMQKTDLLIVTCEYSPFPGGIATYCKSLAATLGATGCQVAVIAPDYDEAEPDVPNVSVTRPLKHHSIPPKTFPGLVKQLRALPKDAIILCADIRSVAIVYALRFLHGRSFRAMVHGSEVSKLSSKSIVNRQIRQAYLQAEKVYFNSDATARIFRTTVGDPKDGLVTHLGLSPDWYVDPPPEFEDQALSALPECAKVFCSVGRLDSRKGQLQAIEALAACKTADKTMDNIHYVVVGKTVDVEYRYALIDRAHEAGINLLLPGPVSQSDLLRLFSLSVAHLLFAQNVPGKIEGFGLVLLEAGAQACPSIVSDVGGIPEVVGDAGIIVSDGKTETYAKEITRLLEDEVSARALGERMLARTREFTWENCARASFPEFFVGNI